MHLLNPSYYIIQRIVHLGPSYLSNKRSLPNVAQQNNWLGTEAFNCFRRKNVARQHVLTGLDQATETIEYQSNIKPVDGVNMKHDQGSQTESMLELSVLPIHQHQQAKRFRNTRKFLHSVFTRMVTNPNRVLTDNRENVFGLTPSDILIGNQVTDTPRFISRAIQTEVSQNQATSSRGDGNSCLVLRMKFAENRT